jgi:undecaprenyl diphosphate synthase
MQSESHKGLHVAIIVDGNGRWATRRGLPRVAGHRAGVASVRRVVERSLDLGIARLTLYAFSSDNWRRPASEVQGILWLLRAFLRLETERLRRRGVRLRVIGRRDRLPNAVLCEIEKAESITAAGSCLSLCVAIDYSARDAITRAAIEVNAFLLNKKPSSPDLFQPLLIRTGGEKRLSDFLLWESANAELLFTDRMWSDFEVANFDTALDEFNRRERRFGEVPATNLHSATSTTPKQLICSNS